MMACYLSCLVVGIDLHCRQQSQEDPHAHPKWARQMQGAGLPCGCKLEGICLLLAGDGWLLVLRLWLPCHLSIADNTQIIQEMQTINYTT